MSRVEAVRGTTGGPPIIRPEDVKAIRYRLKQSQAEFALMMGVSLATLQGWEEGRHRPDGPAVALLRVTARNPKIVAKTLGRG
ncbi:MAG TPA: helix-turn-helix domain-containing protein [Thermoanaerobaculia bacterium]|nr:helix-turn-helix domain-containing protein [Thermoanaerobaculia bacterium]